MEKNKERDKKNSVKFINKIRIIFTKSKEFVEMVLSELYFK